MKDLWNVRLIIERSINYKYLYDYFGRSLDIREIRRKIRTSDGSFQSNLTVAISKMPHLDNCDAILPYS